METRLVHQFVLNDLPLCFATFHLGPVKSSGVYELVMLDFASLGCSVFKIQLLKAHQRACQNVSSILLL